MGSGNESDDDGIAQQCRGCGCKVGSDVLATALNRGESVEFEDAAVIGDAADGTMVASTDFFSSPFQDTFLSGRVAALHCASDVIASGGRPTSALANIVLPPGDSLSQQRALSDLLDGARQELAAMGATLVGGHTIVGPRMELGFTVVGNVPGESLLRKGSLRSGDQLILTKPLGVGVLLAAHMRCECRGEDYRVLVATMLQRQHLWATVTSECGIIAGTDITGFGLAGHLLEMLESSQLSASIQLANVPLLPGAVAAIEAGVESTLSPANRAIESKISANAGCRENALYKLLFDPQTCGGFLFGVAKGKREGFLEAAARLGLESPTLIGVVESDFDPSRPLRVTD